MINFIVFFVLSAIIGFVFRLDQQDFLQIFVDAFSDLVFPVNMCMIRRVLHNLKKLDNLEHWWRQKVVFGNISLHNLHAVVEVIDFNDVLIQFKDESFLLFAF